VEQKRSKQIDICAKQKREMGNKKLKKDEKKDRENKIKIEVLNEKTQFNEYSGLFSLISNPNLTLVTGTVSVSLLLLKVGILGCVAMDVAPPYWTVLGVISSRCLSPGFPW
jgi:hypothetical protein